ncbi:hypothetical protein EDD11_003335 [Mortierella claussenii]|nr:hypothetical protein EDD11_003335 [Mortierella claussenii]
MTPPVTPHTTSAADASATEQWDDPYTTDKISQLRRQLNGSQRLLFHLDVLIAACCLFLPSFLPYMVSSDIGLQRYVINNSGDNSNNNEIFTIFEPMNDGSGGGGILRSAQGFLRQEEEELAQPLSVDGTGPAFSTAVTLRWLLPLLPFLAIMVPWVTLKVFKRINQARSRLCQYHCPDGATTVSTATLCPYEKLKRRIVASFDSDRHYEARLQQQQQQQDAEKGSVLPSADSVCDTDSFDYPQRQQSPHINNHRDSSSSTSTSTSNNSHARCTCNKASSSFGPRPKTLVITGLCLWILLTNSAPKLGLNNVISFSVISFDHDDVPVVNVNDKIKDMDVSADNQVERQWYQQPYQEDPFSGITISPEDPYSDIGYRDDVDDVDEPMGAEIPFGALVVDAEELDAMVRAADDDEVWESEKWVFDSPPISPSSGQIPQGQDVEEKNEEGEIELSAMRDFWNAEEIPVKYEEGQDPTSFEMSYMNEPSDTASSFSPSLSSFPGYRDDSIDTKNVFEYVPGWTEAMLFLVTMSISTVAVGLRQLRHLAGEQAVHLQTLLRDLSDVDEDDQKDAQRLVQEQERKHKILSRLLLLAVFGIHGWMIATEFFTPPARPCAIIGGAFLSICLTSLPANLEDTLQGPELVMDSSVALTIHTIDEKHTSSLDC